MRRLLGARLATRLKSLKQASSSSPRMAAGQGQKETGDLFVGLVLGSRKFLDCSCSGSIGFCFRIGRAGFDRSSVAYNLPAKTAGGRIIDNRFVFWHVGHLQGGEGSCLLPQFRGWRRSKGLRFCATKRGKFPVHFADPALNLTACRMGKALHYTNYNNTLVVFLGR